MNDVLSFHTDLLRQQSELGFLEQPFMLDLGCFLLFSPEISLEWPLSHKVTLWAPAASWMQQKAWTVEAVLQTIQSFWFLPSGSSRGVCVTSWQADWVEKCGNRR